MLQRSPILALLLSLCASACLENEEVIDVHADGSVDVRVRAKGDLLDLLDGHPLSLAGPWRPASRDAERFLQLFGTATGGPGVRARIPASAPIWSGGDPAQLQGELVVEAHFATIADWPQRFGPDNDPYADALPARRAQLDVRREGKRTVFVFERRYAGRLRSAHGPFDRMAELAEANEALWVRLAERAKLLDAEWQIVVDGAQHSVRAAAEEHARAALAILYVEGDASLDPEHLPRVLDSVRARSGFVATKSRLGSLYALLQDAEGRQERHLNSLAKGRLGATSADPMAAFVGEFRVAVRAGLDEALAAADVPKSSRNAVLHALEWGFAADDAIADLDDESFTVRLRLPGTLVGGNFDSIDDEARATWTFEGKDLQRGDVVLSASSVM